MTRAKILEEAAQIAERVGRECHYGPCDTNYSGEATGRRIAEALRRAARHKRAARSIETSRDGEE